MEQQTKFIVDYQEIDKKLKAVEDELNGSEEAKKYFTAYKFLSTVKDKLLELDKKAQVATDNYNSAISEIESLVKSAKEFEKSLETCETEDEVEYLKKKCFEVNDKISLAEQKANALSKEMNELYNEYKKLGQANNEMKAQYAEYKPKLDELKNSKKEEVQKLKAELKQLEDKIEKSLMEKYQTRRKDKKFPIVFGLDLSKKMNYCPFCATSMPINFMEELSSGVIKECESCHRLIYGYESKK